MAHAGADRGAGWSPGVGDDVVGDGDCDDLRFGLATCAGREAVLLMNTTGWMVSVPGIKDPP